MDVTAWTRADEDRLRELSELECDGLKLSPAEYAELRDLMARENAAFVAATGGLE